MELIQIIYLPKSNGYDFRCFSKRSLEAGNIYTEQVSRIMNFGAFVDLGGEVEFITHFKIS